MSSSDRRMEIVSILMVSSHVTSRERAEEFLSWTVISHTTIRLISYEQENSKKCMMRQREKMKNL